jgi:hypothetical protein
VVHPSTVPHRLSPFAALVKQGGDAAAVGLVVGQLSERIKLHTVAAAPTNMPKLIDSEAAVAFAIATLQNEVLCGRCHAKHQTKTKQTKSHSFPIKASFLWPLVRVIRFASGNFLSVIFF